MSEDAQKQGQADPGPRVKTRPCWGFAQWLAKSLIKDHDKAADMSVRAAYGVLEGWVSIIINTLLFMVKLAMGIAVSSIALVADAVHTLSDTASSIVLITGFNIAKKPSDKEHPFGHGRMEFVTALIIAILLVVTAVELLRISAKNILAPSAVLAGWGVIVIVAGTLAVKELLARFSFELGHIIDSQALKADATHHRSDVFSSIPVIIALIGSRYGLLRLDGIMGVGVSIFIIYSAYKIAKEAIDPLLGEPPAKETIKRIEDIACAHKQVHAVHDIICHKYGQTNVISLHIEVSDKETASVLHDLSERVEADIVKQLGGMVVIHVDPINRDHPLYGPIEKAIAELVGADPRIHKFHDLRIVGCAGQKCNVLFDIVFEQDIDDKEGATIARHISSKLRRRFPRCRFIIKPDPKYAYTL